MRTAQECLIEAERCEAVAATLQSDVLRVRLGQIAANWRALAVAAEKRAATPTRPRRRGVNDNRPPLFATVIGGA